jgi:drug/metabolite transporter (DMT)-like permease
MAVSGTIINYRYGLLAALAYGLTAPMGKLLLLKLSPYLLASLSYLGAGMGMIIIGLMRKGAHITSQEAKLTRKDLPYLALMVILDALAPIFLFLGLSRSTASTVALLNNFEIVATSVIALVIFKEAIGRRVWFAIVFLSLGGVILSVEDWGTLVFSPFALCVLAATILWGLENNVTRMLSLSDPLQIVTIKGIGSGALALILALFLEKISFDILYALLALLLGFVSIGLSVYFYILSQRMLGAARTASVYVAAPFIGVTLSFIFLHDSPAPSFYLALVFMLIGMYLSVTECHDHFHTHQCLTHDHKHGHFDLHHNHPDAHPIDANVKSQHSHTHNHDVNPHSHAHLPDLHHRHGHSEDGEEK